MKLLLNSNNLEILDGFSYRYKRDVFVRNGLSYIFKPSCSVCGDSFMMRINYPTTCCSKDCSHKSNKIRFKISNSLKNTHKKLGTSIKHGGGNYKGNVVKHNLPLYDTYSHQLIPVEEVRRCSYRSDLLEVRCVKCGVWFVPKRNLCENRAQFIKGHTDRESRFYCSVSCKFSCSLYHKKKHPDLVKRKRRNQFSESQLRVWSAEVLKRAKYMCEYCGKEATVAHHIKPKKLEPFFALDPDFGIACCKECHIKYGHSNSECKYIYLANKNC